MIRQFLLSLLFFQFVLYSNAQNLPLLHTSDAFWEYFQGDCAVKKTRIYPVGDTILNSKEYTIFKNEVYSWQWPCGKKSIPPNAESSNYMSYIRIQDGKIFLRQKSGIDSLIFDSYWNIGDTIIVDEWNEIFYVLNSIDTVNIGGADRRRWTFKGSEFSDGTERPDGIFIEGIGGLYSSLDVLPIGGSWIWNWEYESFSLDCFTLKGNQILGNNCELGTHTLKKHVKPEVHIIIDHTNDILKIQSDIFYNSALKIQLIDLNGRIILNTIISGTNVSVKYPQSLKGIYLVKIRSAEISYQQKILIR